MSDAIVSELCEIGTKYGTDKAPWCWGYTKVYSEWVKRDIKTVFEVGVLNGASLRMWRDYFPDAQVFGVDNDTGCMVKDEDRISTFCFDAYDSASLLPILQEVGLIDLFVDDGDHAPAQQIRLLQMAWPHIKSGGIYAIEDIMAGSQITKVEAVVVAMQDIAIFRVFLAKEGYAILIMRKA